MSTTLLRSPSPRYSLPEPIAAPRGFVGPDSEYGMLEEVLLASPQNLSIVPCNRVSEDALERGRRSCSIRAGQQHRGLLELLRGAGVKARMVPPMPGLPDLTFTRDTSLMTPWGLVGLRPGAAHRRREVDAVLETARAAGIPILARVDKGSVEGGDVCLLRPGHLVIGVSGNRTTAEGADALGRLFGERGWQVTQTPVDPEHLHLDTHFCVVDRNLALACIEMLDPAFIAQMRGLGIDVVRVHPEEVTTLGCNVLSLGGKRVLSTGSAPRVDQALRARGFAVLTAPLDEFTQCGGGVHCLTMPLKRRPQGRDRAR